MKLVSNRAQLDAYLGDASYGLYRAQQTLAQGRRITVIDGLFPPTVPPAWKLFSEPASDPARPFAVDPDTARLMGALRRACGMD